MLPKIILSFTVCLTICSNSCFGSRILFYFGFSSYSDRIAVWPLVEALTEAGHQVAFLSPYPPRKTNPKVQEIIPPGLHQMMTNDTGRGWMDEILDRRFDGTYEGLWYDFRALSVKVCEAVFEDEDTRSYLRNSEYDMVVIGALYNECGFGLAYMYGAHSVLFATSSIPVWHADAYGFFPENNWIPDITRDYSFNLGFLEKVQSTLHTIYWHFVRKWADFPEIDQVLSDALQVRAMPGVEVLEKNVSLILVNNHYSVEFPRSLPPLYVSVAGMHCHRDVRKLEPLPKELQEFLGDGNDDQYDLAGFVYINLGDATVNTMHKLPKRTLKMFFDVLAGYNIRFLWRWEGEKPDKMPANVMTVSWVPQQSLLAHPKIRGFISHAGLLSVQEAITNGVPMIVFPIFADQDYNAEKVQRQGYGIRLDIVRLRIEGLKDAISNMLNEPRYKEKLAQVAKLFEDRPMKPLDTALWWTEYILRNNGGDALKPASRLQNSFQRRLMDVWSFLMFLVFLVMLIIFILLRQICIILLSDDEEEEDEEEKKKKKDNSRPPSPRFDPRARYIKSKFL